MIKKEVESKIKSFETKFNCEVKRLKDDQAIVTTVDEFEDKE